MDDRFNTAAGWLLFAGIIGLGLSSVSSKYFHGDGGEPPEEGGYPVEGAVAGAEGDDGPPLANLLAAGDVAEGQKVFAKCTACHTVAQGGANGIGPNLWAVMGTPIGAHAAGFAYSSALADKGGTWGYEEMDAWLKSPRGFASGTKMSFAGLSNPEDRANVILYMRDNGGGPPLPEPVEEVEGDAVEGDAPGTGTGQVEGTAITQEAAGAMASEVPTREVSSTGEVE